MRRKGTKGDLPLILRITTLDTTRSQIHADPTQIVSQLPPQPSRIQQELNPGIFAVVVRNRRCHLFAMMRFFIAGGNLSIFLHDKGR